MPRHAAIAVGAALLAAALVVVEFRMDGPWANGVLLAVAAVPAALLLAAGLRERPAGDPSAATSALLLGGLAVLALADYRLWQVVSGGDTFDGRRTLTAFFAVIALVAAGAFWRSRSAAVLLVAALAAGGTLLAAVHWIFDTENVASYRPVLVILAVAYAAGAWALRDRARHRDVLVDAAGFALLGLLYIAGGLFFFGAGGSMPDAWEAVVVVGSALLVAYAAVTRAPGPGVLAIVLLATFATTVGYTVSYDYITGEETRQDPSLVGWPLVLLVLGGLALAYGLTRRGEDDVAHRPPPEDPADVTREVRL